jgi:hypothetical protein
MVRVADPTFVVMVRVTAPPLAVLWGFLAYIHSPMANRYRFVGTNSVPLAAVIVL